VDDGVLVEPPGFDLRSGRTWSSNSAIRVAHRPGAGALMNHPSCDSHDSLLGPCNKTLKRPASWDRSADSSTWATSEKDESCSCDIATRADGQTIYGIRQVAPDRLELFSLSVTGGTEATAGALLLFHFLIAG
jgi:hypothetical protein